MPLNTDPNFPPSGNAPFAINREWCMGDSLGYMNANFDNFDTRIIAVSTVTRQIVPTTLFVPVNYSTRSNQRVNIANEFFTGNTSGNPWWSGIRTVTLTNVPQNTVGILVHVWFNVNSIQNNSQSFLVRKDATENWGNPTLTSTTPVNITDAQKDAFNNGGYVRINMDPAGQNAGTFEAESDVTFPVYINTTTNTFQWSILDGKEVNISSNPGYTVIISLLGYYLQVV